MEQKCIDFKHFFEAVAEEIPSRVNVDFYGGYKVCQAIDAIKICSRMQMGRTERNIKRYSGFNNKKGRKNEKNKTFCNRSAVLMMAVLFCRLWTPAGSNFFGCRRSMEATASARAEGSNRQKASAATVEVTLSLRLFTVPRTKRRKSVLAQRLSPYG